MLLCIICNLIKIKNLYFCILTVFKRSFDWSASWTSCLACRLCLVVWSLVSITWLWFFPCKIWKSVLFKLWWASIVWSKIIFPSSIPFIKCSKPSYVIIVLFPYLVKRCCIAKLPSIESMFHSKFSWRLLICRKHRKNVIVCEIAGADILLERKKYS